MDRKKKTNSLANVRRGPPRTSKPTKTSRKKNRKSHLQKKIFNFEPSSSIIRVLDKINDHSSQEVVRPGTSNMEDVGEAESSSDIQMNRKKKTNSSANVRRDPPRASKPTKTSRKKNRKSHLQKKSFTFEPSSSSIRGHDEINDHSSQEVVRPGTSNMEDVGEAESSSDLQMNRKKKTNSSANVRRGPPSASKPIMTSRKKNTKPHLQRKSVTFEPSSSSIRGHDEINDHSSQEVIRSETLNVQDVGEAESISDLQMNRKKKTNSSSNVYRGPPRASKPIMTSRKKNTKPHLQKKSVTFESSSPSIRDHDEINNHSSQEVVRPGTSNMKDVGDAESKLPKHRKQSRANELRHSAHSIDLGTSRSSYSSTTDDIHRMPILKPTLTSKTKNTKSHLQKEKRVTFKISSSNIGDHDERNNPSYQGVLRPGTSNVQDAEEIESRSLQLQHRKQGPTSVFRHSTNSIDLGPPQYEYRCQIPMPDSENLIYDQSMRIPESNNETCYNMMSFPNNQLPDCENSDSDLSGYSTDFYNTHMMPFSYNQMPGSGYCPRPVNMNIGYNNIPFPLTGDFPPLSLPFGAPARLFGMNQLSANHFFNPPNINEGIPFPTWLPRIIYTNPSDIFMNDDPRSMLFPSLPTFVTQNSDDPSLPNQASYTSTYMPYSRYQ